MAMGAEAHSPGLQSQISIYLKQRIRIISFLHKCKRTGNIKDLNNGVFKVKGCLMNITR